jgi:hypothetical protein
MTALARQVCLNHPHREAVARCVECARFFCRECIADHAGRLICGSCLQKLARAGVKVARTWPGALRSVVKSMAGLLLAWFCFYTVGRALVQLPSDFHKDNFWDATWGKLQQGEEDD